MKVETRESYRSCKCGGRTHSVTATMYDKKEKKNENVLLDVRWCSTCKELKTK